MILIDVRGGDCLPRFGGRERHCEGEHVALVKSVHPPNAERTIAMLEEEILTSIGIEIGDIDSAPAVAGMVRLEKCGRVHFLDVHAPSAERSVRMLKEKIWQAIAVEIAANG